MAAPITALYAGLLGLLLLALAARVVQGRVANQIQFGDAGNASFIQRQRVHGNAVEYIPIGLLLLLAAELNGSSAVVLHAVGGSLFVGRALHAFGLSQSTGTSPGRFVGTIVTWLSILAGAVVCLLAFFGSR
jgi:uncharacterized membrane protein YecN with MAPEG domain